jgi:hypothetical protein
MLVRDSLVFQFKLLVDGTRDLLLVPVSLIATVVSLVAGPGKHGLDFYSVLRFGKRTEHWIDLFGAAERDEAEDSRPGSLDAIVDELEAQILDGAPREELPSIMRERIEKLRRRGEAYSGERGTRPRDQQKTPE